MDLVKFKQQLLDMRTELVTALEAGKSATDTVELDQTAQGRLSRMDAMQQQQMALANERRRHDKIHKIDAALKRIENDTFGYCVTCGDDIPEKRLELDPTIQICIECAQ